MNQDELKAVFDQQASGYEQQQKKLAPVHEGLYFQLEWILAGLPESARILCVGLGSGAELSYLASRFPNWSFTAVEPSGAMLNECRRRAEVEGIASRCAFHEGYLDTLQDSVPFDAATSFMVSQFFLDREERANFFLAIANRLHTDGILVSADLSAEVGSPKYKALLKAWVTMLHAADVPPQAIERTHVAWERDVAILPALEVESIIRSGGFDSPVQFYQAGFVHAWFSKRAAQAAV